MLWNILVHINQFFSSTNATLLSSVIEDILWNVKAKICLKESLEKHEVT